MTDNMHTRDKTFQRWVWIIAFILILLAIALATKAEAQTIDEEITIRWTLPTTGCDNRTTPPTCGPLTSENAVTAVNVYIDTDPIPDTITDAPTASVPAGTTTTVHQIHAAIGTTLYVRALAINHHGPGPLSNEVLYRINLQPVPGSLTIQIDIPTPPP